VARISKACVDYGGPQCLWTKHTIYCLPLHPPPVSFSHLRTLGLTISFATQGVLSTPAERTFPKTTRLLKVLDTYEISCGPRGQHQRVLHCSAVSLAVYLGSKRAKVECLEGENEGIVKRRGPHEMRRVTKSVRGLSWTTDRRLRRKAKNKEDLEGRK
jgi:hypothetical protein